MKKDRQYENTIDALYNFGVAYTFSRDFMTLNRIILFLELHQT